MLIKSSYLFLFISLILAVSSMYTGLHVQKQSKELAIIHKDIKDLDNTIRNYKTELVKRSSPDYLANLAKEYLSDSWFNRVSQEYTIDELSLFDFYTKDKKDDEHNTLFTERDYNDLVKISERSIADKILAN